MRRRDLPSLHPRAFAALVTTLVTGTFAAPITAWAQDGPTRMVGSPAISADHLAFVYDGDLWIADRDGAHARRLTTHHGVEGRPRFSPDGKRLLSMSNDNTARVWDLEGRQLRTLTLPQGVLLYYATWSPDGRSIVTCAGDGTAKIWRSVDWTALPDNAESNDEFESEIQKLRDASPIR